MGGNALVFTLVPLIEAKVARHKTFSMKEMSTVLKLCFFQAR